MAPPFTAGMRDRQARGKDPYLPETTLPAAIAHRTPSMARMPPAKHPKEPFQRTERRDWAETVLDNPELLMMYAHSSGDTLPVTRLRFKKIMCGLDDYDDEDLSTPDLCPPTTAPGAAYYAQGHPQQRSKSAQQHSLGRRSAANTGGVLRGLRP
ncbi:hypothetical protein BD289DRAFT_452334 [Coniella lustricola]|uniref:Uncharacterized protein n=1 Tax=Coniella lustricola TaxID=2025994 RepID=A0A2T3ABL3_9PEZI|nr:hypothetical protein BD289DRAFT_452334 [Coniella lustricola]